ncbi:hypothetical protein PAAG_02323 [Paracoccidioides lutzii Pb01]|uniref:Pyridoxamine 5'-phosphate oxidase Alr4036 family FMN-binding domain-containing protein n=1 Tax=Paracoccidioides lutzii (strain ATCC MYA-826 / Pb01) TaxID=502779 RepID=C1GVP6_PARBA|nr:hypothetical protein PAAG_02323 [Paracoccidioides lutzii Pb01]EEH40268.2 hypothetical protein PAAG_02323 [Paracoccidioides lutzii Pb01]
MASQRPSQFPPPSRATWRPLFQSHMSKLVSPEFSLSTVYRDSSGVIHPRVRTCIFRGFWTELRLGEAAKHLLLEDGNTSNEGGINPNTYESDLLTFTTDVRMEKIAQIFSYYDGSCSGVESGGGGRVEAVFWVKDVMTQWRIKGRAFIVGGDSDDPDELKARENIWPWVRRRGDSMDEDTKRWSWDKEITAHFANLSPTMRGSFKNPPPGTPMSEIPANPLLKLGQMVDDLHDPIARANFRVIVIVPEEVEKVDLTSPEEAKRVQWTLTQLKAEIDANVPDPGYKYGTWEAIDLWP